MDLDDLFGIGFVLFVDEGGNFWLIMVINWILIVFYKSVVELGMELFCFWEMKVSE